MKNLMHYVTLLVIVFGFLLPPACVIAAACRGNQKPLIGWLLLSALSAVWFLFVIVRPIRRRGNTDPHCTD